MAPLNVKKTLNVKSNAKYKNAKCKNHRRRFSHLASFSHLAVPHTIVKCQGLNLSSTEIYSVPHLCKVTALNSW